MAQSVSWLSVYGFDEDTPIEISGQATQENGAVASFYSFLPMPAHEDGESVPITLHSHTGILPAEKIRGRVYHHGSCASCRSLDHHAGGGRE